MLNMFNPDNVFEAGEEEGEQQQQQQRSYRWRSSPSTNANPAANNFFSPSPPQPKRISGDDDDDDDDYSDDFEGDGGGDDDDDDDDDVDLSRLDLRVAPMGSGEPSVSSSGEFGGGFGVASSSSSSSSFSSFPPAAPEFAALPGGVRAASLSSGLRDLSHYHDGWRLGSGGSGSSSNHGGSYGLVLDGPDERRLVEVEVQLCKGDAGQRASGCEALTRLLADCPAEVLLHRPTALQALVAAAKAPAAEAAFGGIGGGNAGSQGQAAQFLLFQRLLETSLEAMEAVAKGLQQARRRYTNGSLVGGAAAVASVKEAQDAQDDEDELNNAASGGSGSGSGSGMGGGVSGGLRPARAAASRLLWSPVLQRYPAPFVDRRDVDPLQDHYCAAATAGGASGAVSSYGYGYGYGHGYGQGSDGYGFGGYDDGAAAGVPSSTGGGVGGAAVTSSATALSLGGAALLLLRTALPMATALPDGATAARCLRLARSLLPLLAEPARSQPPGDPAG